MFAAFEHRARLCLLATVVALTGCASMTEEECLTANWYERGVMDGRNGQNRDYVQDHHEACAKVGVIPDDAAWRRGHSYGIREYCTPDNGERVGRQGRGYNHSCPVELESGFLQRYRPAYRVYQAEQRVNSLNSDIQNKERALDREKDEDKRRRLRREIRDLDDRIREARHELYRSERELRRY